MAKKELLVIFGGRSSEHDVSCVSVQTVAKACDLEKYNMTLVGITRMEDGFLLTVSTVLQTEAGRTVRYQQSCHLIHQENCY